MEYFVDETDNDGPLGREQKQRAVVLRSWRERGMAAGDVGLLFDADETFTRDSLLAARACDLGPWREPQSCRHPLAGVKGATIRARHR